MLKQNHRLVHAASRDVTVNACIHELVVKARPALLPDRPRPVIAVMTESGIKSHQIYFRGRPKGGD